MQLTSFVGDLRLVEDISNHFVFSFFRLSAWRTTCRPTFTRIVNSDAMYSFLIDPSKGEEKEGDLVGNKLSTPSCTCLEQGLEPCEEEDIVADWQGVRSTLLSSGGLCSTNKAKTPIWSLSGNSRAPDSSIYFAFSGLGRFHCPLVAYKHPSTGLEDIFTFTKFESKADLNSFCERGLDYWEDDANPLVCTSAVE